jgi:hypothetical protein
MDPKNPRLPSVPTLSRTGARTIRGPVISSGMMLSRSFTASTPMRSVCCATTGRGGSTKRIHGGASGRHHRDGDIAIDERGAGQVVLRDIFVRLVSDVERPGAKHDAYGANVVKMNEVAPAG